MNAFVVHLAATGHVLAAVTRRSGSDGPPPPLADLIGDRLETQLPLPKADGGPEVTVRAEHLAVAAAALTGADTDLTQLTVKGAAPGTVERVVNATTTVDPHAATGVKVTVTLRSGDIRTVALLYDDGSVATLKGTADVNGKIEVTFPSTAGGPAARAAFVEGAAVKGIPAPVRIP